MAWERGGMVDVNLDVSDLSAAVQERFADRIHNLPMDMFANLIVNEVDNMFQTEGEAGSVGEWSPLKPSTLEAHPRRSGGMILQDTGAMAAIQVFSIDEFSITVGSNAMYAKFHLDGTVNMVKRDFFALNYPHVLDEMGDMLLERMQ